MQVKNPYLAELMFYFKGAYPPFVYEINPSPVKNYIPVFISHTVTEKEFEDKLIFIKENNYQCITVSKLYEFIKGKSTPARAAVCLTFDDGHRSLYETAFPLIKKYDLRATAFIAPAFIDRPGWIRWEQIKEMSESGIIEFQSHTLEHKMIFTGDKIIGYNHPGMFVNELQLDKPTIIINGIETKDIPIDYPIYKTNSRMSNKPRYLGNGRWETPEAQKDAIFYDLSKSKKILEDRINKSIQHLAYPWGVGSGLATQLSRQAEYLTNFWGPLYGIPYNRTGCNPYKLVRLKDDYIFRLPGKGRYSLSRLFLGKSKRRKQAKKLRKDIY